MAKADVQIQKQNLISKLEHLDDAILLQRVSDFLDGILAASDSYQDDNDWKPNQEEIQGIKEALKEVEEGKFVSLEEAKERHKKWLE